MSDAATPDEVKKAYQLGISNARYEISLSQLTEKLGFSKSKAAAVIQKLVQSKAASAPRQEGSDYFISVRDQELALRLRKIDSNETYLVFCAVESSGAAGAGSRDIMKYVNDKLAGKGQVTSQAITKALKFLEVDRIIKQIKSIQNKARKLYIVANIEADTSVVGGAFYKDGEFDDELVENYRERILTYISSHGNAPLKNILPFVKSSGFRVDLGDQDLQLIFKGLVLDQLIVATVQPQTGEIYYSSGRWPPLDDFEMIPCISCPHFETCQIEDIDRFDALMLRQPLTQAEKHRDEIQRKRGVSGSTLSANPLLMNEFTSKINPSSCPYYSQWLGLTFEPTVPKPADADVPKS